MCFFNCKTNYEVSTPISLKTNTKTLNYCIEHLHICVFSNGSKRVYIYVLFLWYALSKLIYQVVYQGKLFIHCDYVTSMDITLVNCLLYCH